MNWLFILIKTLNHSAKLFIQDTWSSKWIIHVSNVEATLDDIMISFAVTQVWAVEPPDRL